MDKYKARELLGVRGGSSPRQIRDMYDAAISDGVPDERPYLEALKTLVLDHLISGEIKNGSFASREKRGSPAHASPRGISTEMQNQLVAEEMDRRGNERFMRDRFPEDYQ